jgi:hypothetical protein
LEDFQVERALQLAALDAMNRAERCDTGVAITVDGQARVLRPNEFGPYRQRALKNLERINQKIAELEGQSQESAALVLNDRSAGKPPGK